MLRTVRKTTDKLFVTYGGLTREQAHARFDATFEMAQRILARPSKVTGKVTLTISFSRVVRGLPGADPFRNW